MNRTESHYLKRWLEDEDENPDPCEVVDDATNTTATGETRKECVKREMKEDMEKTTTVFLGVIFFLIVIGIVCCALAYRSCWQNTVSFAMILKTEYCACCNKKKDEEEKNDGKV